MAIPLRPARTRALALLAATAALACGNSPSSPAQPADALPASDASADMPDTACSHPLAELPAGTPSSLQQARAAIKAKCQQGILHGWEHVCPSGDTLLESSNGMTGERWFFGSAGALLAYRQYSDQGVCAYNPTYGTEPACTDWKGSPYLSPQGSTIHCGPGSSAEPEDAQGDL